MNVRDIDTRARRDVTPGADVQAQFVERWSPRALSGEPVAEPELKALFEAARWAPSCFNEQPWRFALARKGSSGWEALFPTLAEANQAWAKNAGALVAVITRTEFERNENPSPTAGFDAGAAWMSLALQASHLGLVAHGMYGFDQQAARAALRVPEVYELLCVVALGHPGDIDKLPEKYAEREAPSGRKALADILFTDDFSKLAK